MRNGAAMKDNHKKQLLMLIAMIAATVALGGWQYYPIHRQKGEIRRTLEAQTMTMDQIREKCGRLPFLYREVLELEPRALEYDRRLPSDRQFALLWQQIAEIMNRNRLSDQLVRPGEQVCEEEICMIPLSIECTGTFEQIFGFFRDLETFDRLIRMEEIQLKNDKDLSGRLNLSARAQVFYQSDRKSEN